MSNGNSEKRKSLDMMKIAKRHSLRRETERMLVLTGKLKYQRIPK
jgi:hypothetical protein